MAINQGKYKPTICAIDEVDDRSYKLHNSQDEIRGKQQLQQIEGSETAPLTTNQQKLHMDDGSHLTPKDLEAARQDALNEVSGGGGSGGPGGRTPAANTPNSTHPSANGLRGEPLKSLFHSFHNLKIMKLIPISFHFDVFHVTCSVCVLFRADSFADSRPAFLRCADEPVAQAPHPVRDDRLPVRPAPADHHPAAGLLAGSALLHAGANLPGEGVRGEQPAAAALGQHLKESVPRDVRVGLRQLCQRLCQPRLLCDQAGRVELQDLQ